MPSATASDGRAPRAGAEDHPSAGHVIELDDALGDIERMVIRQRDHAGAEADAVRALTRRGEEQLGRGDHFPAGRLVLAAPEFVESEFVQVLGEGEIASQLQHRMLADRVVWRQDGAELQTWHACFPKKLSGRPGSPSHLNSRLNEASWIRYS